MTQLRASASLTMAEVAAQAGVSRQAVYLHFTDRTALLVALMRHVDEGRAAKVAAIAKAPSARAAVAAVMMWIILSISFMLTASCGTKRKVSARGAFIMRPSSRQRRTMSLPIGALRPTAKRSPCPRAPRKPNRLL